MKKKSPAFYRYCQDMANDSLSYYEADEIETVAYELIEMNMIEEAEAFVEKGMTMHPNDESVEKIVIWIYLHHHQAEKAEEMFQKYRNDGSEWSIRMQFAFCTMHGHPQKALDDFLIVLENGQLPAMDWVSTIDEMYEALPLKVLSPYLVQAIGHINDNAEALGRIGSMLIEAQQIEQATVALEKALDLDAYDIYSWQDLTRCYLLLEDIDKCIETCDFGLAIDEQNPLLNFIRGYLHYEKREFAECIPYLTVARKFAEGKIEVRNLNLSDDEIQQQINVTYEMLGAAFLEDNQNDKALECFQILAERNPDQAQPIVKMASIYLLKGDLNQAKELLNHAIDITPDSDVILALKVSVLTTMHNFDEALDCVKEILKTRPENISYLMTYGKLAEHTGRQEEADAAYRKILDLGVKEKTFIQFLRNYFTRIDDQKALERLDEIENESNE